MKKIDMQVQEAQRVPNKMGAKRSTPRHIKIKMPKVKDKEKLLKARENKLVTRRLLDGRRRKGEEVRGLRCTNR